MSAPTARHDLRCPAFAGRPCDCGVQVVTRLPVQKVTCCALCGGPGEFQVDPNDRACERCLGAVVREVHKRGDGWLPVTVAPVRGERS